jgi:hypothetical protein
VSKNNYCVVKQNFTSRRVRATMKPFCIEWQQIISFCTSKLEMKLSVRWENSGCVFGHGGQVTPAAQFRRIIRTGQI